MLGVATNCIAFAGKSNVYFRPLELISNNEEGVSSSRNGAGGGGGSEYPTVTFPEELKAKNCYVECISVSSNGELLGVADSAHGVHIFERKKGSSAEGTEWLPLFTGASEKRIVKLQFTDDNDNQYLTLLDKQGDIFAIRISADHQVSHMKKIMGHTSFISDYITRVKSQQIFSCDRDEKIRISNFPDAFIIQGFKLGHTESVISMALLDKEGYLISVSVFGTVILWDSKKEVNGTSTESLQTWNLKAVCPGIVKGEVTSMKAYSDGNVVFLSVTFAGSTNVSIFRIQLSSMKMEYVSCLDTESNLIFMEWTVVDGQTCLIVFSPLNGSLKWTKFAGSNDTDLQWTTISDFSESLINDIKALGETHKPCAVPMKKRQTTFEHSLAPPPSHDNDDQEMDSND